MPALPSCTNSCLGWRVEKVTVASKATGRWWVASAFVRARISRREVMVPGAADHAVKEHPRITAKVEINLFIGINPTGEDATLSCSALLYRQDTNVGEQGSKEAPSRMREMPNCR